MVELITTYDVVVEAGTFIYAPPILSSLSSNQVECAGGGLLTVYGQNLCEAFLLVAGDTVSITELSPDSMTFEVPPMTSYSESVVAEAGGQISNALNYSGLPPVINSVSGGPFGCAGGD